ncbi:GNAT family N-acetyltransferase [Nitratireductor sp. CAU 1489]|uniref:GNAT family N-acetyltransferase n=1 Tax=Nitratireductor arenosus TaxID=2682096 RepID=A0A844QP46_9HYPH|nr:GNAT family N-acetyltransferase [Nitratireductor arenosus]MVA99611.1 GNAT family N-acetyltransferase [Nitratireductor arenosus]
MDVESVCYRREQDFSAEDFRRVLEESGLGATRPVDDLDRLARMLAGADLIVTARLADGTPVGVARCITDFSWSAYLPELAISRAAQGLGVGKKLIAETRRLLGDEVSLTLASMPDVVRFYEKIGMESIVNAFWFRRAR